MVRNLIFCLILVLAVAGCGQVNINIEPKSAISSPSVISATKTSALEVTAGSNLNKVTGSGYKVNVSVSPYENISMTTTPGGYKVRVGVTGLVAF